MLRRLRDLLAHTRAGHRIGCETCAGHRVSVYPMTWTSSHDGEPLHPPVDLGQQEILSRPHTLYIADPDELTSESQKHSDSAGSPVDETFDRPHLGTARIAGGGLDLREEPAARSPVDAARERGEL